MNIQTQLLELDDAVERLNWGINAVGAVAQAISAAGRDYAEGLFAVWEYLYDAHASARSCLSLLLEQNGCQV